MASEGNLATTEGDRGEKGEEAKSNEKKNKGGFFSSLFPSKSPPKGMWLWSRQFLIIVLSPSPSSSPSPSPSPSLPSDGQYYARLPLDEKRQIYKCGSKFVTLDMIETWSVTRNNISESVSDDVSAQNKSAPFEIKYGPPLYYI